MSTPPVRPASARRDRRGRGRRGPLAWPGVPAMVSRRQRFDDLVLDAAERLERTCGRRLPPVEYAVEDVPPALAPWEPREAPLGRLYPATGNRPARIVVYRRPIETRAPGAEIGVLVHDVVTEQLAELLGVAPEDIDPRYEP